MSLESKCVDLTGKFAYNSSMIKKYRLKLNLSQEQLANELGFSIRTIRNLEAGKSASPIVTKTIKAWIKEICYQEQVATKNIQK